MDVQIELSIVIPLYNEVDVIDELTTRVAHTMDSAGFPCEAILIDDGSHDGTRQKIDAVCASDPRFRAVMLSRNFGHQAAVSAGFDFARGDCVAVIDGDLQDPPEILLTFHRKILDGHDVVYAIRQNRKENALKRFCYWSFYRLFRRLATIDMPLDSGDFCMMTRRVVRHIQAMPERHRFIRGMRSWVGFRQVGVPYRRDARAAGRSKYTLSKLIRLAIDGIFTFSELPVRLATLLGTLVATSAFLWGVHILVWRILNGQGPFRGFATLACGMLFVGGLQLICMGLLGEYIARIHNEVMGRPIYVVDRHVGPAPQAELDRFDTGPVSSEPESPAESDRTSQILT